MKAGLQLYSIREDGAQYGFEKMIEMAAQAGYDWVEFAGYGGLSGTEMKQLLDKYGIAGVSTHAGFQNIRDNPAAEIDFATACGYKLIVCPGAPHSTLEEVQNTAAVLEAFAQRCKPLGITVGYHNHSSEFRIIDGKYALDILYELAPTVKMQLDCYWAANADVDPVEYLTPYAKAGRVCSIHAKEMACGEKRNHKPVGEGCIDFKTIKTICNPETIPYIVEQEEWDRDHLSSITASCTGVKNA